jgi:hypothetical protein
MRLGPFFAIAILLFFVWGVCFLLFHGAGLLIHLLLLFAALSFVAHIVLSGRPA